MPAEERGHRCAREVCKCVVQQGQTYCSQHCARADAQKQEGCENERCGCGHAACDPSEL